MEIVQFLLFRRSGQEKLQGMMRLEKHHGDLAEMSICNNSLPRTHVMSTAELLMQDLTTMWSINKPYQASH